MAFHEVTFPTDISYGSRGGAGWKTQIATVDSGAEERVARWSHPRHRFNVRYGVKTQALYHALKTFYLARQGALNGFRFKDWTDYTTGTNGTGAAAYDDVTIGTGDASDTTFQLFKTYTSGAYSYNRPITKVDGSSVVVGINAVEQESGWSVDSTTGIVTFDAAPGDGLDVTAGVGEFYVPGRFGEGTDDALMASAIAYDIRDLGDIVIEEITSGLYIPGAQPNEGSTLLTPSADLDLSLANGMLQLFSTTTAVVAKLPVLTNVPMGGPIMTLENLAASTQNVTVKDSGETVTVATLTPGDIRTVFVGDSDGIGTKAWY